MKFLIVGGALGLGVMMMYSEGMLNKRKMKQMVKKMNVL